jgi:predicted exporter
MEPPDPYRVVFSEATRRQLLELQQRAVARGRGEQLLSAAKVVVTRLQSDPLEFGELRKELRALRLQERVAVVRPLVVIYAVDAQRRLVYVTAFRALAGTDVEEGPG